MTDPYYLCALIDSVRTRCGCELAKEQCGDSYERSYCTLPAGHDGCHVACDYGEHGVALWPKEDVA